MRRIPSWIRLPVLLFSFAFVFGAGWLYGPDYGPGLVRWARDVACSPWPKLCLSPVPQPSTFFSRSDTNRKVLVFVHGVTGTASDTWKYSGPNGEVYWPEIVRNDSRLKDYDIYIASYFTPQLDAGPTIASLARAIRTDLEKAGILPDPKDTGGKNRYDEVIFICHSMGNLVIRNMILFNQPQNDPVVRIPLILSLASPSAGSVLAELMAGNPNEQFKEMAKYETNSFLQLLNEMYKRSPIDTEISCAYEEKPVGPPLNRLVVEKESATAVCTRPDYKGFEEDHISIVKPSGINHPVHKWAVEQILQKRKKPGWVLDRWADNEIIVGGKDYLESNMHAAMIKLVLESDPKLRARGLKVATRYGLGHASRMFTALVNKDIDIYPEYDGSILYEYLRKPMPDGSAPVESGNADVVNRELQKGAQTLNMRYLDHLGYNDPYVFVMNRSKARERGLLKNGTVVASDVVQNAGKDLIVISDQEFFFRSEWYGVKEHYGLKTVHFDQTKREGLYNRLRAADPAKLVPVGIGFGSDPELSAPDMIMVVDDKHVLPDYYPAPLVNKLLLRQIEEIEPALEKLKNIMTIADMRSLENEYEMRKGDTGDNLNQDVLEGVARAFLEKKGKL